MATAEQLKALLRSHVDRDDQRFYSIALQVAAKEARKGHTKLASDIKDLIDKSKKETKFGVVSQPTQLSHQPKGELQGLLEMRTPLIRLNELILAEDIKSRLKQVILEQTQKDKLHEFGLQPRRKLMFTGCPGTGKTMSANVLANELKLPLYTIVLDSLITRFMGETAAKLRLIFDHIQQTRAVYLFDEFDAIGAQRGTPNDVGEIRRVLNSFLMFVEQDNSESIIVAATNHPELLDKALHRRFDDIIRFRKPEKDQIYSIIINRLTKFDTNDIQWDEVISSACDLSAAEITRSCEDAAKEAVLYFNAKISTELLVKALERRQQNKN